MLKWKQDLQREKELHEGTRAPEKYKGPGLHLVQRFDGFLKRASKNEKSKNDAE